MTPEAADTAVGLAALTAFADRVMQRRPGNPGEVVICGGGSARMGALPDQGLLLGLEVEGRGDRPGQKPEGTVVRLAVGLEPEWIVEAVPEGLSDSVEHRWDAKQGRVLVSKSLRYGLVVLESSTQPAPPSKEASAILAEAVEPLGLTGVFPDAGVGALRRRTQLLAEAFPGEGWIVADEAFVAKALQRACDRRASLAQLRDLGWQQVVDLPPAQWARLAAEVPTRLRLPGGRQVDIHYPEDQPPWIESRLQDFFGMKSGPTIGQGRVPLVLHLLAPNRRAVQVTRDLAGFWREHYPALRRQLSRRYPKHAWPEDGVNAEPPTPRPARRER